METFCAAKWNTWLVMVKDANPKKEYLKELSWVMQEKERLKDSVADPATCNRCTDCAFRPDPIKKYIGNATQEMLREGGRPENKAAWDYMIEYNKRQHGIT